LYLITNAIFRQECQIFAFSLIFISNVIIVLIFFTLRNTYKKQILEQVDDFNEDRVRNISKSDQKNINISQLAVREILGLFVVSILNNTISSICFPFFVGINSFSSFSATYAGFSLVFFAAEAAGKYWARIPLFRLRDGFLIYIVALLRIGFVIIYFYITEIFNA